MEFRQGRADERSFPAVLGYLRQVIDDFHDRFENDEFMPIFEDWHRKRVEMLDSFDNPDYMQKSQRLQREFDELFFIDPDNKKFQSDKFEKVRPVITEITYIVSRGK